VRDVTGGGGKAVVEFSAIDNQRVGEAKPREVAQQGLGFGGLQPGRFDDDEVAVLGFGGERMLESECAYLLRQVGGVRAHHRAEGPAAAAELRHAGRTVASATR